MLLIKVGLAKISLYSFCLTEVIEKNLREELDQPLVWKGLKFIKLKIGLLPFLILHSHQKVKLS